MQLKLIISTTHLSKKSSDWFPYLYAIRSGTIDLPLSLALTSVCSLPALYNSKESLEIPARRRTFLG